MTGGSAGSGGYNFQAYVIAFVSAHVLVGRRLAWLHHQVGKPDVPVAVSAETGGPGDDVQIDLDFFKFEAQAKKGLRVGPRLDETIDRFGRALQADSSSRGVIVVDQTSHSAVKDQLRNDLQRLRDGRDDDLKDVTIRVLGRLAALNVSNPKEVASRISVVVLDLEESGGAHSELAQVLLRDRLENPSQEGAAWNALVSDGHQLIQRRGKRDREAIERFIGGNGLILVSRTFDASVSSGPDVMSGSALAPQAEALTATPSDPLEILLTEAIGLIQSRRTQLALTLLDRIEKQFSETPPPKLRHRVANNRGVAYLQLNEFPQARTAFEMALALDPDSLTALGNLAQAELMLGDFASANGRASDLLKRDPLAPIGWSVKLQASERLGQKVEVPTDLEANSTLLATRGFLAFQARRFGEAKQLLESAIAAGNTTVDTKLMLADATLMSAEAAPERRAVLEEAFRRSDDALRAASEAQSPVDLERALLLHALILEALGDRNSASRFYNDALAIPRHSWRVEFFAARNQMFQGRHTEAEHLLTRIPAEERVPEVWSLIARAFAELGKVTEAEEALRQIPSDQLKDPEEGLNAAETAIAAGLLTLAEELLKGVRDSATPYKVKWLEARLLARQEESDATDIYRQAAESAPVEDVPSIQIEHAGYLARQERYADAIQLFEAADVLNREDQAHRGYARALYEADELSKLSLFLDHLAERGTLAPWAVEFAAEVAFARQDYSEAEIRLRDLLEKRPGHLRAAAKRAGALIELKRTGEARVILEDLAASVELPADLAIGVAQLLVRLGEDLRAMHVAYSALQKSPGDPNIQLAYANIFLHRGDKDAPDLRPDVVGPRTWVVLHAGGKRINYHLVDSKASPDATRNELSPQDGFGKLLIGLKVGEKVVARRGQLSETEYEVAEIKSEFVYAFQDVMSNFPARFPENTNLQAFDVGEGTPDLSPFIAATEQRASTIEFAVSQYKQHGMPLGFVARLTGRSVRETYQHFASGAEEIPVYVEAGDADSLKEALNVANDNSPVVVTATGLTTLQVLGRLDLLKTRYPSLVAPPSLLDELDQELHELQQWIDQGGAHYIGKADGGRLSMTEVTVDALVQQRDRTVMLMDWIRSNVEIVPRPTSSLTAAANKLREMVGASSFDSLMLAADGSRRLYADDFGLRRLGAAEHGIKGFSTVVFAHSARDAGLLTPEDFHEILVRLVGFNHEFVPISADTLYQALRRAGFAIDSSVLKVFDRLRGGKTDLEPALRITAALLRTLALEQSAPGLLERVAALCFETVSAGRPIAPTMGRLLAHLKRAFALMPLQMDILERQLKSFVNMKTLGRSPLI